MKAFNPEKELKKIQHGNRDKIYIVIIILLLIISIGSTYALYQVRYSKRIIYTKVAPFNNFDIELSVYLDDTKTNDFPTKESGYYFNGLDCETEGVTQATWNYNLWTLNLSSSKPNKCNVNFSKSPSSLTDRITFLNNHKDENMASIIDDDPGSNIRYIGANPDNYIWFNCDDYDLVTDNKTAEEQQCEKWRIIGLMNNMTIIDGNENTNNPTKQNLVKIIRAKTIGYVAWNSANTNNWTNASLQTNLNNNYLASNDDGSWITKNKDNKYKPLTDNTKKMIEKVRWNIGGLGTQGTSALQFYNAERSNTVPSGALPTWDGLVALIYASDYIYATAGGTGEKNRQYCLNASLTGSDWQLSSGPSACAGSDWLLSTYEAQWTLTPLTSTAKDIFVNHTYGGVYTNPWTYASNTFNMSPTLYLKSNIQITGGTGSEETPYIINNQ